MLKIIKRNPINTGFVIAIGVCLVVSSGNLKQQADAIASIRSQAANNNQRNMELRASLQNDEMNAKIADQRYKAGCLKLKGALVQGKPVWKNGSPLPKGIIVCDRFGNTGKLVPRDFDGDGVFVPVVGETAYTGNQEAISSVFGGR